ncbi:Protein of uncharacterised function (DUF551) [Klebsiella pneumoniae]|nr:Protein of uncharacterised function (DUF551) [Klebsiella pneumoniae]
MTKSTITREQVVALIAEHSYDSALVDALEHLLSAMDSEPVEMPLDYLQGHKDGLEWASQLAEANHPETGDWLYDDPIELAKAIRKGPDMPPVQPVADSEPVAEITEDLGRLFVKIHYPTTLKAGDKLYRHAQPAPVVEREPIAWLNDAYLARGVVDGEVGSEDAGPGYIPVYREAGPQPAPVVPEEKPIPNTLSMYAVDAVAAIAEVKGWNACRAAMLHAGNSPAQSDCCPAQNHVSPEQNGDTPAQSQGWIQVSEQMPPSRHEVLVGCWWGEKPRWCCKWATYIPGHPDAQSSGWLIPGASWTPTHWMQLPAGPQEVKSES